MNQKLFDYFRKQLPAKVTNHAGIELSEETITAIIREYRDQDIKDIREAILRVVVADPLTKSTESLIFDTIADALSRNRKQGQDP